MGVRELTPREEDGTYRQLKLKIWHAGCWTLDVTDANRGSHIIEKSLHSSDDRIIADLILRSDPGDVESLIESIEDHELVEDITVLKRSPKRARVIVIYTSSDSIVPEIVNSTFMPIEPVHVTGGHEFWTVIARSDILTDTLSDLQHDHNVDVLAVSSVSPSEGIVFTDFIDEVYDTLSDRQIEALLTAHEQGYYEWPREVKAKEIAAEFGVAGPTVLEHLRKAERKLLVPMVERIEAKRSDHHFLDR